MRKSSTTAICCLVLLLDASAQAQSYALSNLWSAAAGDAAYAFLSTTDNAARGLAYNPATGNLLVVSRTGSPAVHVLDSTNGTILETLAYDSGVISGGTFVINMIGITTDGVIYVANLTTDATGAAGPFRLYRWANESALPELAYSGDPSGGLTTGTNPRRFGDSLALRGTGTSTQILLGTYNKWLGFLTTTDGMNFSATQIVTDVAEQDTRFGLAWGAGDTCWVKQASGNLKLLTLDLVGNTAVTTISIPSASVPGGPLDVDPTRKLLAIVDTSNTTDINKHKLRLFDISDPAVPRQMDSAKDFPAKNVNGNATGAVSLREGKLFALDTNNGILAYYLEAGIYFPVAISAHPADVTLWEGAQDWTYNVGVSGTPPFFYQWQHQGADLAGETLATLTISNLTLAHAGSYRVVVTNFSGSATSNPSTLTVQVGNASGQMINVWNLAPGSQPYLTTGYKEYGVAINPLTTNVIVVTRENPTNMIAVVDLVTGAHKHYVDYSGLTLAGGVNRMNKVDVAEDGTIYICNVTGNTGDTPFTIYGIGDDSPYTADQWIAFQGDPGYPATASTVGWGANIAVRGAGLDTQILVGGGKWSSTPLNIRTVAILKPNPDYSFSSTPITIADAPDNVFRFGIDWGPGTNTFWVKANANSLLLVEFDEATQTGFIKQAYPLTGDRSVPSSVTGIKYDAASGLLAGLQNGTAPLPVSIPIYDVRDLDAGPLWVDQELFTTYNPEIEYQGNVDFGLGYLVALGVNNGLKAFRIDPGWQPPVPTFKILSMTAAGGEVILTWEAQAGASYQVQYADSLTVPRSSWMDLGSPVLATGNTASFTNTVSGAQRFYQVITR